MSNDTYTPPKVWEWDAESGGKFATINRPIAGPTHDKDLPVGDHPFQLYSLATPNGVKVTIMFEELLAAGVVARARGRTGLAEEQPAAYKDVDQVVECVVSGAQPDL